MGFIARIIFNLKPSIQFQTVPSKGFIFTK